MIAKQTPRPEHALRPILKLSGVGKTYCSGGQPLSVLKDIDLTLHAGAMVAIVGPSGSGKSTLMNILGCLDRPSCGSYQVGGRDTRGLGSDALASLRRRHFGFIFQRYHLLPHLSALRNVELPAIYAGLPPAERQARARQLLNRLGLGERLDFRPGQLSGGQQQRVAVARALMNGGKVILADEPTGALDSDSGREMLQQLLALRGRGHTIIVVTHDARVAACAERIIELADGRIVSDRPNEPTPLDQPAPDGALPRRDKRAHARPSALRRLCEAFDAARGALLSHRLRTALTMLGIVIGIASVVAIMAVGEGSRRHMDATIGAYTSNLLEIRRGTGWDDARAGGVHTLVASDVEALVQQPYVEGATPLTRASFTVRHRDASASALVSGVAQSYFQVRNFEIARGRAFGPQDVRSQAQVAVIDAKTRHALFGAAEDPVGRTIIIGQVPFTVIGVMSTRGQEIFASGGLTILLPYTTAGVRLFGRNHFDAILVRLAPDQESRLVEDSVTRLLTYKHGARDFFTNNMDSLAKAYASSTRSVSLMLSLVASIALVVGGVGVMNIMLVSVTERTREIGIRMAVGARRSDILKQFLAEAVAICLIGGAGGVLVALLAGPLFSAFVKEWRMVFAVGPVVFAFACATLVGVAAGFVPARKGAGLDPCVALARE